MRSRRDCRCPGRRATAPAGGAGGELVSRPYRGSADELDLDATLAALVEHPLPSDEDIIVRDRSGRRRAIALLVDVSGSMRGERIRTAAATVGALAGELDGDDLAVIAFWSDAAVIQHLGQRRAPRELLDEMLRISARGLTNVEFPLRVAARELARAAGRDVRALLLSDCVHNAGPDPRPAAAALPRLDVMLDVSGENDPELGRALARRGTAGWRSPAPTGMLPPASPGSFALDRTPNLTRPRGPTILSPAFEADLAPRGDADLVRMWRSQSTDPLGCRRG